MKSNCKPVVNNFREFKTRAIPSFTELLSAPKNRGSEQLIQPFTSITFHFSSTALHPSSGNSSRNSDSDISNVLDVALYISHKI
jgi:hypothetical protein